MNVRHSEAGISENLGFGDVRVCADGCFTDSSVIGGRAVISLWPVLNGRIVEA